MQKLIMSFIKMEDIDVSIISKHMIKSSASSSELKPYKLSLLDQIFPAIYVPLILFYPISASAFNLVQTLADLRRSFSHTLTFYYPFSGRVKNNLYIDDFDAGVPYNEARVKCDMIDFLGLPNIECLNKFVALKPFSKEAVSDEFYPLLGVQVNVFDSGLAIGVCVSHKLIDGATANGFLTSWGAVFRGRSDQIIHPNLSQAALLFPHLPEKYRTSMQESWFAGKKVVTRRFVFDSKALSKIQDEAKSELVPEPSRVQSLTGFLWKHMIAASLATTDTTTPARLFIASQAVNLRSKIDKDTRLDNNAIGNLILGAKSMLELNHNAQDSSDLKLCDTVALLNKSLKQYNSDYLKSFTGKEGYGNICEYLDMSTKMSSMKPAPEIYSFSSWTRSFGEVDFGWGRSSLIGVYGKIESAYSNLTILIATKCDTGIEAWVNFEEEKMAMLEKDPHFIKLASPKHLISRY